MLSIDDIDRHLAGKTNQLTGGASCANHGGGSGRLNL
jgi:hypothetical protein